MNVIFCKPKKLKTHESNFYEAVNLSKSLKTASKDPVLVPGKCSRIGTESGKGIIPKHCTKGKFRYILRCLFRKLRKTKSTGGGRWLYEFTKVLAKTCWGRGDRQSPPVLRPFGRAASVCLLFMTFLLGASRLALFVLRLPHAFGGIEISFLLGAPL